MQKLDAEKLASYFASAAVAPTKAQAAEAIGLVKSASGFGDFMASPSANYLLGGLGGAGAGALMGALQPEKNKRKSNMLYYGGMGGLAGVGAAHLYNNIGAAGKNTGATAAAATAPAAAQPDAAMIARARATGTTGATTLPPNTPDSAPLPRSAMPIVTTSDGAETRAQNPLRADQNDSLGLGSDWGATDNANWLENKDHSNPFSFDYWNPLMWLKGRDQYYKEQHGDEVRQWREKAKALTSSMLDVPSGETAPTQQQIDEVIQRLAGANPGIQTDPLQKYKGMTLVNETTGAPIPEALDEIRRRRSQMPPIPAPLNIQPTSGMRSSMNRL